MVLMDWKKEELYVYEFFLVFNVMNIGINLRIINGYKCFVYFLF